MNTTWIDLNAPSSHATRQLRRALCESRIAQHPKCGVAKTSQSGKRLTAERAIHTRLTLCWLTPWLASAAIWLLLARCCGWRWTAMLKTLGGMLLAAVICAAVATLAEAIREWNRKYDSRAWKRERSPEGK